MSCQYTVRMPPNFEFPIRDSTDSSRTEPTLRVRRCKTALADILPMIALLRETTWPTDKTNRRPISASLPLQVVMRTAGLGRGFPSPTGLYEAFIPWIG
jgi:hypothetical protein